MSADSTTSPAAERARARGAGRWGALVVLAWRNVWRNPVRSLLTMAAMVVGLAMMIFALAVMEGLIRQMVSVATDVQLGHAQLHRQKYIDDGDLYAVLPWELLEYLEAETPFAYAPRAYASALASAGDYATGVQLQAVQPEREARVTDLAERVGRGVFHLGTWPMADAREVPEALRPEGAGRGAQAETDAPQDLTVHTVVVGIKLANRLRLDVGSELVLITQGADGSIGNGLFRVVGVMKPISPAFDRRGVLMSMGAWQSLVFLEHGVHEIAVHTPDALQAEQFTPRIREAVNAWGGELPFAGAGPVRTRAWQQINPAIADSLQLVDAFMYIIMLIVFSIVALGLVNTVLMALHERTRELGMLLALGIGRGRLMAMVLLEAVWLALLSAVLGSALGAALSLYLGRVGIHFGSMLPEGMDWAGVAIEPVYYPYLTVEQIAVSTVALTLIMVVAAAWPAWRTTRLRPVEALHG